MRNINEINREISNYWTKRSFNYDKELGHMFQSNHEKELWKKFLKISIGEEQKLILDVGCGTGFLSILLTELNHKVIGIDISEGMLNIARKNSKNLKIPFLLGDSNEINFLSETFDVIISRHLLWTLQNPRETISNWKNLLVKGGSIIIIDGNWDFSKENIYNLETIKNLPLYGNKERPLIDIDYLTSEGFKRSLITIYEPKKIFGENLEYLEIKDYFLIKAIKS